MSGIFDARVAAAAAAAAAGARRTSTGSVDERTMWTVMVTLTRYPAGTSGARKRLFYSYLEATNWVQDLLDDDTLELQVISFSCEPA